MIEQNSGKATVSGRVRVLLASTTLATGLAGLATSVPAWAESVTTSGDVSPSPADSPNWTVAGPLFVGLNSKGTLTIEDGGAVSNTSNGFIGVYSSSTSTVTVTGGGSTWTNGGALAIGSSGTGTLNIEAGGAVSNTGGYLGEYAGSTGAATVTGAGSKWTNSGKLYVGRTGDGTLTVADGGAVSNTVGFIGADSTGAATVTGNDSTWTNSDELTVGYTGTGTLTVEDSGNVSNTNGYLGFDPDSTGTVTVTGAGSKWTNSGQLYIGNSGAGTLNIEAGGAVSNTFGYLGFASGSTGTATVTGEGSKWTNSEDLIVGRFGDGTLNIRAGGGVSNLGAYIGYSSDTTGAATVTGEDSKWTNSGALFVGMSGKGTLTVAAGGAVSNTAGYIGAASGSTGAATVTGDSSKWTNSGELYVGHLGDGTLTVADGGEVTNSIGHIGVGSTGVATVTGNDSKWTNSSEIHVGYSGTGTLAVEDGGEVSNIFGYLGYTADSAGTARVTGPGSKWTNSSEIHVGSTGAGTLNIEAGGAVSNTNGYLGYASGSTGTATVTGSGSKWMNSNNLSIGYSGVGTLTIAAGGAVSNGGGTIALDVGSIGAVMVTGGGSTWVNDNLLVVGNSGAGTLSIADGGKVSNLNGLIGGNSGSTGTATVTGAGSNWANNGDLTIGVSGSGTLTIANGGAVSVNNGTGIVVLAEKRGSTGTLNIGAAAGQTAVAAGTLDAAEVQFGGTEPYFGTGTGLLQFNHTNTDYAFDAALTGAGAIDHAAGTTALTGDSSGFTGMTTVSGGTLLVNGTLGGTMDVLDGARLGGSGTVGTTVVASGGTITPGNSIGTLKVDGDITFDAGSGYDVEVDPVGTDSDLIQATGKAILNGGSVVHVGMGGTYDPTSTYTILTAAGGVEGVFDGISSNFAFLDPTLAYDTHNVILTLDRNAIAFCSVGLTRNECDTGAGVESLGLGNAVYDAVLGLDEATARAAFDQLSGEIHASIGTALIDDSRHVRNAAMDRIRAAFEVIGASTAPIVAYGPNGATSAPAGTKDLAAWSHAFGSWGETDGDGNAASLDRDTGGFLMGADALVGERWRLGLLAGYSHSSFKVDARASSGSSDNYHLGLYGGTQWGALGLRAGAAYSWHDIETNRSVRFTGFADSLDAGYDAGTTQVFAELGYAIDAAGLAIEPFAGLAYVNLDTDSFTENGGAAALAGTGGSTDVTFSTLGARVASGFAVGGMTGTARGLLGWSHAFGDVTPTTSFAFAGGDAFTIAGVPIAQDAVLIEAGFDLDLSQNATLGLSYGGQFGSGAQDHSATANFTLQF